MVVKDGFWMEVLRVMKEMDVREKMMDLMVMREMGG